MPCSVQVRNRDAKVRPSGLALPKIIARPGFCRVQAEDAELMPGALTRYDASTAEFRMMFRMPLVGPDAWPTRFRAVPDWTRAWLLSFFASLARSYDFCNWVGRSFRKSAG